MGGRAVRRGRPGRAGPGLAISWLPGAFTAGPAGCGEGSPAGLREARRGEARLGWRGASAADKPAPRTGLKCCIKS